MQTLNNWFLVQLTDIIAIGDVSNGFGREKENFSNYKTSKVLAIDLKRKLIITRDKIFKLGPADPIWLNTSQSKILTEVVHDLFV